MLNSDLPRTGGCLEHVKSVSLPFSQLKELRPEDGGDLPRVTHLVVTPTV